MQVRVREEGKGAMYGTQYAREVQYVRRDGVDERQWRRGGLCEREVRMQSPRHAGRRRTALQRACIVGKGEDDAGQGVKRGAQTEEGMQYPSVCLDISNRWSWLRR